MIDFSHLANTTKGDFQVFHANSRSFGDNWYTWRKPRGCNFVQFTGLAGGGGGSAGSTTSASRSTNAAGQGGGSSGFSTLIYPLWALPNILYITVGFGGRGESKYSPVVSATTGTNTCISLGNNKIVGNVLLYVNGGGAGNGVGYVSANGAAGTEVQNSYFQGPMGSMASFAFSGPTSYGTNWGGNQSANAGQSGGTGGSKNISTGAQTNTAQNVTAYASSVVTGGGGGGAAAFDSIENQPGEAGGIITSTAFRTSYNSDPVFGNGNNGAHGFQPTSGLFTFYGGNGGDGASRFDTNIYNGGNGGNGAYGCGGGGGGAAGWPVGSLSGNGGNGGDGLVVSLAW